MMTSIRISDTESLNISAIQSLMVSEREVPKELHVPSGSETVHRVHRYKKRETVLTITKNDGKLVILHDARAGAALAILRQHGF